MDRLWSLDPRFAPAHAAYYLQGLQEHTGAPVSCYTTAGFPSAYTDHQPLAFVLERNGESRNLYIAAGDKPDIDAAALEWADVYGKVNLDPSVVPATGRQKVTPIGPSHRLNIWTLRDAVHNAVATHRRQGMIVSTRREHYRQFWILYRRALDSSYYEPGVTEEGYVFYNSWLWWKHQDVNPARAEFIRTCKELDGVRFEGGFTRRRRNDMPEYDGYVADKRYSLSEFLANVKHSTVVFNNPAVHRCHGWKLAEFLRLGKAIVSLPLERDLPAPLVHGEHFHVVDGSRNSIKAAVIKIVDDSQYRRHLEESARAYYLQYLAPARVIGRLADLAFGTPEQVIDQPMVYE